MQFTTDSVSLHRSLLQGPQSEFFQTIASEVEFHL